MPGRGGATGGGVTGRGAAPLWAGWLWFRSEVRLANTPETPGIFRTRPSAWRRTGSNRSASLGSTRIENITRLFGSTTTWDSRPEPGRVVPAASTVTSASAFSTSSRVIAKIVLHRGKQVCQCM